MYYFDTHAHLNDEKIFENLDEVLSASRQVNVKKWICVGYDLDSSIKAVSIANATKGVFASVGVHPHDAKSYCSELELQLIQLAKNEKVVALGEIGLDYYHDLSPREIQKEVFVKQILLAEKLNMPIIIHSRDASGDMIEILEKYKPNIKKALMHCFNGSVETLERILKLDIKVAFGGAITFKNAKMDDIIKRAGLDNIMLETDCPYLSPVPFRGQVNEPKNIPIIAEKIAEVLMESVEVVMEKTYKNAKKFFNISEDK